MHSHNFLGAFTLICGLLFSGVIIRLLLRRRINERNSVAWLLGAVAILIVSANPGWLDWSADKLGIGYPPTLLFLFSTLVLLTIVLHQSMQISVLHEKLRQLAQHVALRDGTAYDEDVALSPERRDGYRHSG